MTEQGEQEQHNQNYQQLVKEQQTLLLSTVSAEGKPECSYTPYIKDLNGTFFIFVSALAKHTQNMQENELVSILFIQNEQDAKNLFARKRAIFDCSISQIKPEYDDYDRLLDKMTVERGETVKMLRSLPDFYLLQLTPLSGRYIAGFGQAFKINIPKDVLEF
jgi:putative heme iron utilization protein